MWIIPPLTHLAVGANSNWGTIWCQVYLYMLRLCCTFDHDALLTQIIFMHYLDVEWLLDPIPFICSLQWFLTWWHEVSVCPSVSDKTPALHLLLVLCIRIEWVYPIVGQYCVLIYLRLTMGSLGGGYKNYKYKFVIHSVQVFFYRVIRVPRAFKTETETESERKKTENLYSFKW